MRPTKCNIALICGGGSRAAATSKMERFVIIVNGFQSSVPHTLFHTSSQPSGLFTGPTAWAYNTIKRRIVSNLD